MKPILGIIFGFSIIMLAITLLYAYNMFRKYRLRYFFYFLWYLVCFFIFGFLHFILRYLLKAMLNLDPTVSSKTSVLSGLLINFTATPAAFMALYFLFLSIRELSGSPISLRIKRIYLASCFIILIVLACVFYNFSIRSSSDLADLNRYPLFIILNVSFAVLWLLTLVQIFFLAKIVGHPLHQRRLKIFGSIFLIIFATFSFMVFLLPPNLNRYFYTIFYFSMNLIPLLYYVRFLNSFYLCTPQSKSLEKSLYNFLESQKITKREREIIHLIREGKTNQEIEDILFISLQTVKNNIYNIYKKLKVKNRVELTNLISQHLFQIKEDTALD